MLVLSRKKNEGIVINNDIKIVIVEIRGDKVRLGVEAPREVPVHRQEVYDAIQRHNAEVAEEFSAGRRVSCKQNGSDLVGVVLANTNGNLLVKWDNGITLSYTPKLVETMGIADIGVA